MSLLLLNKVIIVTGAGQGIGRGVALVLAREGAKVVLAGRHLSSLEQVRQEIEQGGGKAQSVVADVANGADCEAMVAAAVSAYGRLDCAVNNAGIDGELAPTADYAEEIFDRVIAVNLKGIWNCMRYQIPAMLAVGGGSIVNISSALAEVAQYNMSPYIASKYAVLGLSKTAALEYATRGIRVNSLLPGVCETPMMIKQMEHYPPLRDLLLAAEPMGRLGRPEEIGEAAAWMCSDRASFQTGSSVVVDGGYLLR